jgi:tRNA modification GTPase
VDNKGDIIDAVMMVQMPEGKSYTGQKQVEIFCHGGQFVIKRILEEIFKYGARPAEPGEFTKRAFLAGRIDLTEAEAVADMVASKTEFSYSAARDNLMGKFSEQIENIRNDAIELLAEIEASIDFPEEDLNTTEKQKWLNSINSLIEIIKDMYKSYRAGRIIKDGYKIAIVGRTNAGKSSLFNLFLNQSRAIVASTPGTTRDYLTEWIDLDGIAVSLTDTAGLRSGAGRLEQEGQRSALKIMKSSHLIIWIADISRRSWKTDILEDISEYGEKHNVLIVLNKTDKISNFKSDKLSSIPEPGKLIISIPFSCKKKIGFKKLKAELINRIDINMPDLTDGVVVTSARHRKKLGDSLKSLGRAKKGIETSTSPELVAFDLRQGINEIDEITGRIYNEEILDRIFNRFCIGK